jgi:hypothetical protein
MDADGKLKALGSGLWALGKAKEEFINREFANFFDRITEWAEWESALVGRPLPRCPF